MDFYFIYFQSPSPQSPTDHPPYSHPPYSKPHYKIVSSLTIHPFINQLMSNGIVKPFLHKKLSSTVSSLSPVLVPPPICDLRHDLVSNSDNQTVNRLTINVVSYLVGPTPFPRVAPLPVPHSLPPPCHSGSSFCLSKTHQSQFPSFHNPIPSIPPTSLL